MFTIENNSSKEIIINKSRFITELIKIKNVDEVNNYLEEIKNKYKDATHYCYAYIVGSYKKASDDGEPGGTAGMPILNVLDMNKLTNVLCVVIRYFGGIKLGAGGLVRAYSKSVSEALEENNITELKKYYRVEINYMYDFSKDIDYLLKDVKKVDIKFENNITFIFDILEDSYNNIINKLERLCVNITVQEEFIA